MFGFCNRFLGVEYFLQPLQEALLQLILNRPSLIGS